MKDVMILNLASMAMVGGTTLALVILTLKNRQIEDLQERLNESRRREEELQKKYEDSVRRAWKFQMREY